MKHPAALKLAVVALARLDGVDEAARAAKVDVRTVRSWVEASATDHPSEQDWQASRDYAKSQELRAALEGKANLAYAWSKSAGVGQRNLNYERQVMRAGEARREAEKEPEPEPDPIIAAADALRTDQQRLLRNLIDLELQQRAQRIDFKEPTVTEAEGDAAYLEYIARLAALTEEQVAEQNATVEAELDALEEADDRERQERYEAAHPRPEPPAPLQAPPEPSQRLPAPADPRPAPPYGLHVLTDGDHLEDHPSWRREQ